MASRTPHQGDQIVPTMQALIFTNLRYAMTEVFLEEPSKLRSRPHHTLLMLYFLVTSSCRLCHQRPRQNFARNITRLLIRNKPKSSWREHNKPMNPTPSTKVGRHVYAATLAQKRRDRIYIASRFPTERLNVITSSSTQARHAIMRRYFRLVFTELKPAALP